MGRGIHFVIVRVDGAISTMDVPAVAVDVAAAGVGITSIITAAAAVASTAEVEMCRRSN